MFKRKVEIRAKKNKVADKDVDVTFVNIGTIDELLSKQFYEERTNCLEIGDIGPKEDALTVDIREGADFVGDIRGCITNDYKKSSSLETIPIGRFAFVKLMHTIEHIQWIYQDALFNWLNSLMAGNGMLYICTPNLEYITKVYLANIERLSIGGPVRFPGNEYPDMTNDDGNLIDPEKDLQRWTWFKLYSGCSPGDFHHCCHDPYSLSRLLSYA